MKNLANDRSLYDLRLIIFVLEWKSISKGAGETWCSGETEVERVALIRDRWKNILVDQDNGKK